VGRKRHGALAALVAARLSEEEPAALVAARANEEEAAS
jgi:hypothetical protein